MRHALHGTLTARQLARAQLAAWDAVLAVVGTRHPYWKPQERLVSAYLQHPALDLLGKPDPEEPTQLIAAFPAGGAAPIPWHTDNVHSPERHEAGWKVRGIMGVALTDFTEANGCLYIVDDDHPVIVSAGSIFSFDPSLPHRPGPNRSVAPRMALYFRTVSAPAQ